MDETYNLLSGQWTFGTLDYFSASALNFFSITCEPLLENEKQ